MNILFEGNPVSIAVRSILTVLDEGRPVDDTVERQIVDLKEEHGRRDRRGSIGPSHPHNEMAAKELATAAACMANTPGGEAWIVGVSNQEYGPHPQTTGGGRDSETCMALTQGPRFPLFVVDAVRWASQS